jgi:hypothetical protein
MHGWIIDEFKNNFSTFEENIMMNKIREWSCKFCNLEFGLPNIDVVTNERHCPNCYSIKIVKMHDL